MDSYYVELVRGTFYLISKEIEGADTEDYGHAIHKLQKEFGYPIGIEPIEELEVSDKEKEQIYQKTILSLQDGELFYYRFKDSGLALRMGPFEFEVTQTNNIRIIITLWSIVMVYLAIVTCLWMFPFWRKLRHLAASAIDFGRGEFESRATIPKRSSLFPLAEAFNSMADKIQTLIHTQRELTNAVSHELRTPIARIRFSLEMLEDTAEDEEQKHYLSEIDRDIDELDELVTESLTYARLDRGAPKLDIIPYNVDQWLQPLIEKHQQPTTAINISYRNLLPPEGQQVHLDFRYMSRALENLIKNGLEHARTQMNISAGREEGAIVVHVDDDGPGVSVADRKKIFQPFSRVDNSRNRASGGYGLGLAIVERVIAWHGGEVTVSESGLGGARFSLRWPILKQ